VRLRAIKAEGPVPVVAGYDDDDVEARAVARACVDHRLPGSPWFHQAVLARTNAQLDAVGAALAAVGVPARLRGRTPFVDRPVVRAALREIAAAPNGFDAAVARLAAVDDDDAPKDDDLARLVEMADAYRATERRPDVNGLKAWLAANAEEGGDGTDGVELRTFHAAKGLEWPIVHVCGVEEGLVPISTAKTPEALAEERRLLYVAITRAERVLRVTWAANRRFGGADDVATRRPSRHLGELREALEGLWAAAAPAPRPVLRRVVPAPCPANGRVDALQAWRRRRARAAGVSPDAVLPDHVLRAIADADPVDPDAVAAVAGTGHLVAAGLVDDLLGALRGGDG
jgi:DNA helicase-2/ATP-dependent DNA helicase PcrA